MNKCSHNASNNCLAQFYFTRHVYALWKKSFWLSQCNFFSNLSGESLLSNETASLITQWHWQPEQAIIYISANLSDASFTRLWLNVLRVQKICNKTQSICASKRISNKFMRRIYLMYEMHKWCSTKFLWIGNFINLGPFIGKLAGSSLLCFALVCTSTSLTFCWKWLGHFLSIYLYSACKTPGPTPIEKFHFK